MVKVSLGKGMLKGKRCEMVWLTSEIQVIRFYWSIKFEKEN